MSNFTDGHWNIEMRPASQSFADNTSYYLWAGQNWATTTNGYQLFYPPVNMILTDLTCYGEPGTLATTEPCIFSVHERLLYPNSAAYSTALQDILITNNFTWNYTPHPLGLVREFHELYIPMVVGRLYVLRMQIPNMSTNPSATMLINLKGTYETPTHRGA